MPAPVVGDALERITESSERTQSGTHSCTSSGSAFTAGGTPERQSHDAPPEEVCRRVASGTYPADSCVLYSSGLTFLLAAPAELVSFLSITFTCMCIELQWKMNFNLLLGVGAGLPKAPSADWRVPFGFDGLVPARILRLCATALPPPPRTYT